MRTGAAHGQAGQVHEVGFYGSDAEFRALIMPFAEEGIAAGEPVIVGYDDRKSSLLRSWLSDPSAVKFLGDKSLYATPARAIATYRRLFEFHLALGAAQIRIAGDVPHPGNGRRFEGWDRYESAVNTVWQGFPVWARCLYDTTTAPAAVLDVAERTHPLIVSPSGGRRAGDRYQDVSVFEGLPYAPDPLEDSTPLVQLVNRPAADARHALTRVGRGRVPAATLQDLLIGVSEAVSNAQRHGHPPATVRIWAAPDRIVVTVHDTGHGPADRLAGLIPAPGSTSDRRLGMGLWVIHQLDIDVALRHAVNGFTVRLRPRRDLPDRPRRRGNLAREGHRTSSRSKGRLPGSDRLEGHPGSHVTSLRGPVDQWHGWGAVAFTGAAVCSKHDLEHRPPASVEDLGARRAVLYRRPRRWVGDGSGGGAWLAGVTTDSLRAGFRGLLRAAPPGRSLSR